MLRFKRAKSITRGQLAEFWRDFDSSKRVRKRLCIEGPRKRKVVAVSPTVLGTVRRFCDVRALDRYLGLIKVVPKRINSKKPGFFRVQPVEVFGIDRMNRRILERVFMAPTVADFMTVSPGSRYFKRFCRLLEGKGIKLDEATDAVKQANRELIDLIGKDALFARIDSDLTNKLVLDVDKTGKVLFAWVDLGGSIQE